MCALLDYLIGFNIYMYLNYTTGECLHGLAIAIFAACFSCSNIHSVGFALHQPLRSQHSPLELFYVGFTCAYLYFALHPLPAISTHHL